MVFVGCLERETTCCFLLLQALPLLLGATEGQGHRNISLSALSVAWNRVTLRITLSPVADTAYSVAYAPINESFPELGSSAFLSVLASVRNKAAYDITVTDLLPSTSYIFILRSSDGERNHTNSPLPKPIIAKTSGRISILYF